MTRTVSLFYRSCLQAYSMLVCVPRMALALIWRSLIWRRLPRSQGQYINFVPRSYEEHGIWEKGMEPRYRTLRLVYHYLYLTWHVKITLRGTLQSAQTNTFAAKQVRREQLMNLCLCIDFDVIRLLDDTVTELIIECQQDSTTNVPQWQMLHFKKRLDVESEYSPIIDRLCVLVQEDVTRVRYPIYDPSFGPVPTKELSEITRIEELDQSMGTHKAYVIGDETTYVYKEVDRPLYEPRDSETLEKELRNLILLRGVNGIVQVVATVVSRNPYHTIGVNDSSGHTVFRGILLEYHSNGTLQRFLQSPQDDLPWYQWAIQITSALSRLHEFGITHMDLKPTNIVITSAMEAILIDVSGIGGTSRDWLSPEMRSLSEPLSEDFSSRIQNDIWALGKIFMVMANAASDETVQRLLTRLSQLATTELPPRISLQDALSLLSTPKHQTTQHHLDQSHHSCVPLGIS
ncbi:calcium/calmodulin-dependent protein kinase type 1B [Phlyctema vagabunda]|uniref:Calcium/calmodulin-dependent protein kinase type 1B n=1 Tax=Phlyctema vagabunda TaxID=108571 RepID=A0ABR4PS17_9HELO